MADGASGRRPGAAGALWAADGAGRSGAALAPAVRERVGGETELRAATGWGTSIVHGSNCSRGFGRDRSDGADARGSRSRRSRAEGKSLTANLTHIGEDRVDDLVDVLGGGHLLVALEVVVGEVPQIAAIELTA